MSIRRIEPDEAAGLLEEGWTYVDVRSIPEFEQGHPSGAYNIPLLHHVPGQGLKPNEDFLQVLAGRFASDDNLVIGCRSGARSLRAAQMLADSGFTSLVDMRGGFGGEKDKQGKTTCQGWAERGLPTSATAEQGRAYEDIKGDKSST